MPAPQKRIRKAVFPVAGLGTRFLPATKAMPKEMLTVVDRPVIQHVVDEARAAGIEHFIFVTGRNKGVDRGPFRQPVRARAHAGGARQDEGAGRARRASCRDAGQTSFTRQQAPLGLGHAVWCARDIVGDEPFALLLPDMLHHGGKACLAEMIEAYNEHGGNHIAVSPVPESETHQYGIVGVEDAQGEGLAHHADGREAQAGHGAVQPAHHRPLHPAAGDLRHPRRRRSAAPAARSSSPTR